MDLIELMYLAYRDKMMPTDMVNQVHAEETVVVGYVEPKRREK
jgi:hypothetical protein